MTTTAFPFLFYGTSPDDWFDEPVHCWQLRFTRAPSPAERGSLAGAWERGLRDHARGLGADFSPAWWWADAWALVSVRVTDRSRDPMRALFDAMQTLVKGLHGVVPLAEVVYAQAADVSSRSDWETWTTTAAPVPTEAPVWPAEVTTHAKRSRKRTKAATDESFEAARRTARMAPVGVVASRPADDDEDDTQEPEEAREAEETEEPVDDIAGEGDAATEGDDDEAPEPSRALLGYEFSVVAVDAEAMQEAEEAEKKARKTVNPQDTFETVDGSHFVQIRTSKRDREPRLAMVRDGALVTTVHSADWMYSVRAFDPARGALLVDNQDTGQGLIAVKPDDATVRTVWSDEVSDGTDMACWFAGGVFVKTYRDVRYIRDDGVTSYHTWLHGEEVVPESGGDGLLALHRDENLLRLVAQVGDALRVAGEARVPTSGYLRFARVSGALYLTSGSRWWRIDGTAEARQALRSASGDVERFPPLPAAPSTEERNDPTRNTDPHECYARGQSAESDPPLAEKWFRRTLALEPKYAEAWMCLGPLLRRVGRADEARGCFEEALKVYDTLVAEDSENTDNALERARALAWLGRREEFLAALKLAFGDGHHSNWMRKHARADEAFQSYAKDADFLAVTEKVARAKKGAKKSTKKRAAEDDEGDDGDD